MPWNWIWQYTEEEQEAMVSNDVMRLEIKVRTSCRNGRQGLYAREPKQQLKLSMAERKKEIAVHSDVQAGSWTGGGRSAQGQDGRRRKAQINMLAAKYDIVKLSVVRKRGEPKSLLTRDSSRLETRRIATPRR